MWSPRVCTTQPYLQQLCLHGGADSCRGDKLEGGCGVIGILHREHHQHLDSLVAEVHGHSTATIHRIHLRKEKQQLLTWPSKGLSLHSTEIRREGLVPLPWRYQAVIHTATGAANTDTAKTPDTNGGLAQRSAALHPEVTGSPLCGESCRQEWEIPFLIWPFQSILHHRMVPDLED